MYIPTDNDLEGVRLQFEDLLRFAASGQVSLETVAKAVEGARPKDATQIECVPWEVDCSVAPQIRGARVVSHHVYGDLRVTHGDLQVETDLLLGRSFAGRIENAIPMRIGGKLLPAANLAVYMLHRRHLIPDDWWGKLTAMPGTVYVGREGEFVLGLECEIKDAGLLAHRKLVRGDVLLRYIPLSWLHRPGMRCAVVLNQ